MRSWKIAALAALLVGGCSQTVKIETQFNPNEAAIINQKGQATITGQLFLTQRGGAVVYGAGSDVRLIPKTAYASDRMGQIFKQGKMFPSVIGLNVENEDPSFVQYQRTTKADGQGRFAFTDVAPGSYYVTGVVTWCAPGAYGSCNQQGGALMETVTVSGPQKVDVIMNGM